MIRPLVSYLIVDEAMYELEMMDDPFLDQAVDDIPTDLPFADDEDSGCCKGTNQKSNFTDLLFFIKNLLTEKMCCSSKQPYSGSARSFQSRTKSVRCQSASSGLRNLNTKSARCRSSRCVDRIPLEISVIDPQGCRTQAPVDP